MKFFAAVLFWLALMVTESKAQDTLPDFTLVNRNGKIILSWVNPFPVVKQMSIQRSSDSLKGFKTILTLPDPTAVTNGFLDNNAPDTAVYYKLYILLDSGKYIFSKSQKPGKYVENKVEAKTAAAPAKTPSPQQPLNAVTSAPMVAPPPGSTVAASAPKLEENNNGLPSGQSTDKRYTIATASASGKKRSDGLKGDNSAIVKPEVYTPSSHIFTNADGNVTMVLPTDRFHTFSIKFFEEKGELVFEMGSIKEQIVILDKTNFLRSGWFYFELYENGVLKEKNKVLIPRDPGMR